MKQLFTTAVNLSLLISMFQPVANATSSNSTMDEALFLSKVQPLNSSDQERADKLIEKYKPLGVRPQRCPLQSENYHDLFVKLKNIKQLMNGKCHELHQGQVEEILSGVESVKQELETNDIDIITAEHTVGNIPLTGTQISTVMNSLGNLNNVFLNRYCAEDRPGFLATTADIIGNIAQLGILSPHPNGIIVTGMGTAAASILRLIDQILKPQFDFEKDDQRESFIMLNCAFYDLRRDIEKSGFISEGGERESNDYYLVTNILDKIEIRIKSIEKALKEIPEFYDKRQSDYVEQKMAAYKDINSPLEQLEQALRRPLVTSTDVLLQVRSVYELSEEMLKFINARKGVLASSDLDKKFIEATADFNLGLGVNFDKYLEMPPEQYQKNVLPKLLFIVIVMNENLQKKKESNINKYAATNDNKKKLDEFQKAAQESLKKLKETQGKLNFISTYLDRILNNRGESRNDDGVNNIVGILNNYRNLEKQIYGSLGNKFMRYATNSGAQMLDVFNVQFHAFAQKHLKLNPYLNLDGTVDYKYEPTGDISSFGKKQACQDLKSFSRTFRLADSHKTQAYDFIATNRDMFHSYTPNKVLSFGPISGKLSDFEKLQFDERSSYIANKLINKMPVEKELIDRYFFRRDHTFKKNREFEFDTLASETSIPTDLKMPEYVTLGYLMDQMEKQRENAATLTRLNTQYKCEELLAKDL